MLNEKGMTSKSFTNYSSEIVNRDFISKVSVREAIESIEGDMSYAPSLLAFKKLRNILGIAEK